MEQAFILLLVVGLAAAYPYGAPASACQTMVPQHGVTNKADLALEVKVEPHQTCYKAGSLIMVKVTIAKEIEGVLGIARSVGSAMTTAVGEWVPGDNSTTKLVAIDCFNQAKSGITHSSEPKTYGPIGLVWKAPSSLTDDVKFKVTVVYHKDEYWPARESTTAIQYKSDCQDTAYTVPVYVDKMGNPRTDDGHGGDSHSHDGDSAAAVGPLLSLLLCALLAALL